VSTTSETPDITGEDNLLIHEHETLRALMGRVDATELDAASRPLRPARA
jgi:hypothetical protein